MVSYELKYLILEYVSIGLFLFLFGHCHYRGINYTLQIFCIVAILNNLNETILLLVYNGRGMTQAMDSLGCTISAVFEQYLPLVLACLAMIMGFHIWFVIVRRSKYTESQLLKWYCLVAFGLPAILTAIACILLRNEDHLSAYPRKYYCDLKESDITLGTFAIPMLVIAVPGILCTIHSVIFLVMHALQTRRTLNRASATPVPNLALELSYCIRLVIFCLGFGIIILLAVLERLDHRVEYRSNEPDFSSSTELNTFSDFSGSLIGIVVFLVFGTTKDAFRTMGIVFLPCFFLRKKLSEDLESQADLDTAANTLRTSLERPRSSNRRNSGLVKDDDI